MKTTIGGSNPAATIYNSWAKRSASTAALVEMLQDSLGFEFVHFRLPYELEGREKGLEFPLGWSFSANVQEDMEEMIEGLAEGKGSAVQRENAAALRRMKGKEISNID